MTIWSRRLMIDCPWVGMLRGENSQDVVAKVMVEAGLPSGGDGFVDG